MLSSTASLVSISTAASRGRSGTSGAGGYASPLDFSRPSTSGYRKNPIAIGGCLSLHWQVRSDEGAEPWVVEVLRWGYQIPFRWAPTLSRDPIPLPAYAPSPSGAKLWREGFRLC